MLRKLKTLLIFPLSEESVRRISGAFFHSSACMISEVLINIFVDMLDRNTGSCLEVPLR
jgi:hypothetical protein